MDQPINLQEFRKLMDELGSKADSLTIISMVKVIDMIVDTLVDLEQDNLRLKAIEEDLTYLLEKDNK